MIYTTEKCPKCGYRLKFLEPATNYISFGKPFKICPSCGTAIKERKMKEAIQFVPWDKYMYYFERIFFSSLLVTVLSFSPFIVNEMFDLNIEFIENNMAIIFILICIPCFTILFISTKRSFDRGFNESKNRLNNKKYLDQLLFYKFITQEQYQNYVDTGKVDLELNKNDKH